MHIAPLPDAAAYVADYEGQGLEHDAALELELRAARIKSHARRALMAIGAELVAAREVARYGTWRVFLERCGFTERTAQNYMNVYRRFQATPEIADVLPPTTLYALAAPRADPAAVAAMLEEIAVGGVDLSADKVRSRVTRKPKQEPRAPTAEVRGTEGGETIVLTLHGSADDGSLVISDGRGLQLITLNMRRFQALLTACQALDEALRRPREASDD